MENEAEAMEKSMKENPGATVSTGNSDINTGSAVSNNPDPDPSEKDRNKPKPTENRKTPKAVMKKVE